MKKKILCYTDFSENDFNAIVYAVQLYKNQDCAFYILNAFQANKNASDIVALVSEPGDVECVAAKKISEEGLKKIIDTLKKQHINTKHSYKTIASYNSLLYALKDTISRNSIDLVVIGSKGELDDEENEKTPTLDIMEYITECPILAIPGNHKFYGLNKIVLPINYKESINEANFSELLDLVKLHNINIDILHIKKEHDLDENQVENKKLLESILKGLQYSFHILTDIGVNKGINLFIESEQCDLIVFIDEKSNYIGNELPRPLLKELENHLLIPVLALNGKT
jgi:hypothetical protein